MNTSKGEGEGESEGVGVGVGEDEEVKGQEQSAEYKPGKTISLVRWSAVAK